MLYKILNISDVFSMKTFLILFVSFPGYVLFFFYCFKIILRSFWDFPIYSVSVLSPYLQLLTPGRKNVFPKKLPGRYLSNFLTRHGGHFEIEFYDRFRPFMTPLMLDSCFSEVFTSDWTFVCLQIVLVRWGRSLRICVSVRIPCHCTDFLSLGVHKNNEWLSYIFGRWTKF